MDFWKIIGKTAAVLLSSAAVTAVLYAASLPFFSTPAEKELKAQNDSLMALAQKLRADGQQLEVVITGLQFKDASIYEDMFHSPAPNADPVANLDFLFGSDTIPDRKLITYVGDKADELFLRAGRVDENFALIASLLSDKSFAIPPMSLPLDSLSYPQVGAGTGMKMNPFYKAEVQHRGIDFIVPQEAVVRAAADGEVVEVSKSSKGYGRSVLIAHKGGYTTRYAHLQDVKLSRGQRVRRGAAVGTVGMSGTSFASHLHYEVYRDSLCLNPVNYIFASVVPDVYANMLFMSANTLQSLD